MPDPTATALCLCIAWCALLPSQAGAQQPAAPDRRQTHAHAADTKAYSCVETADALARRWLQDEPCTLPMYHLPTTVAAGFDESPRWPSYPPRTPGAQEGHAMFWRFPVQPMGPNEVPRHSRR
jgi:hypothetical protein